MKISIVTVYHPVTNLGSYLQAYALSKHLQSYGHEVKFVPTVPNLKSSIKMSWRLIPKRGMINRFLKMYHSYRDLMKLRFTSSKYDNKEKTDCAIYGSDEIWNICNPFFLRPIFWRNVKKVGTRITYAMSIGHANIDDFEKYPDYIAEIQSFNVILSRDEHTTKVLDHFVDKEILNVLDPTLLVPASIMQRPVKLPSKKYLLVYTYGVDPDIVKLLQTFARQHNLIIVSPCFYHVWADLNIECSALQFGSLIQGAEYVFTTTFHGAIFSLINHSRCAIMPIRPKVRDICMQLKSESRLVDVGISYDNFTKVIKKTFDKNSFETNLQNLRRNSVIILNNILNSCQYGTF